MKHTPGPWRAFKTETVRGNPAWVIDSEEIAFLASMEYMNEEDRDTFGAANAKLIASAPALLNGLQIAYAELQYMARSGDSCAPKSLMDNLNRIIIEATMGELENGN